MRGWRLSEVLVAVHTDHHPWTSTAHVQTLDVPTTSYTRRTVLVSLVRTLSLRFAGKPLEEPKASGSPTVLLGTLLCAIKISNLDFSSYNHSKSRHCYGDRSVYY